MAFREEIAPQLPYLRRYARALTGSQESGDAYVRATLEAILEDTTQFDRGMFPRLALFRVFHRIWGSSGGLRERSPRDIRVLPETPEERLSALAPQNRQALLLTAMEGFSVGETAEILGVLPEEIERLLQSAQAEIDRELATSVLIIEDESVIALHLESLIRDLGHKLVGTAATKAEAVRLAREHSPGLVLADIQLADNSSGIDAVKEILGDQDIPVIFITAYPERLLTGSRPEPTYLVTKPFMPETVRAAIGQALFFHQRRQKAA